MIDHESISTVIDNEIYHYVNSGFGKYSWEDQDRPYWKPRSAQKVFERLLSESDKSTINTRWGQFKGWVFDISENNSDLPPSGIKNRVGQFIRLLHKNVDRLRYYANILLYLEKVDPIEPRDSRVTSIIEAQTIHIDYVMSIFRRYYYLDITSDKNDWKKERIEPKTLVEQNSGISTVSERYQWVISKLISYGLARELNG